MHHRRFAREIGLLRATYRRAMFDVSARKADIVVANSESNRRDILECLPVAEAKVRLVPEALDELYLERRDDDAVAGKELRSRLGLGKPYVLFASTLYRYKNLEGLLEGFAALRADLRSNLDIAVSGYGDPRYLAELRARAQRLGIEHQVHLLGHQKADDLRLLYQQADVFSYPTLYETFGHPPLQAMAQGTPVVASNVSSVPEVVGDAALLHPPTDRDALASSIETVLTDSEMRERLIAAGLQRASKFTWERTAVGLLDAYASALQG